MEIIYRVEVVTVKVIDGRTIMLNVEDLRKLLDGETVEEETVTVVLRCDELPIEKKKIAAFGTSYHVYVSSTLFHQGVEEVFVLPIKQKKDV